ncbi:MAG: hypothetical protein ACTHJT_02725 [Cytophaga sp.]|uniref:hypothetical protein n=1 Tax=Cytophaga sp. TaxID=29535 RepID=UPI003F7CD5BC
MRKIILGVFLMPLSLVAQNDKNISVRKIPSPVVAYLAKQYPSYKKVSYVIENDADTICYEAEFKYMGEKYSVLFDTLGNVIETEIEVSFDNLKDSVKEKIIDKLQTDFLTHKIIKTQEVEYRNALLYELEIKGRKKKDVEFYEYYFERSGVFIKEELIELKPIPSLF